MTRCVTGIVSSGGLERPRKRPIRIANWVIGISGFFFILFIITPLTLPENSVPELSGRANRIDYLTHNGLWSWGNHDHGERATYGHDQISHGTFSATDLNPIAAFTYIFGDLNCHQKHERSWTINGNQMPVCVRDVGIFLGAIIGGVVFRQRGENRWLIRDTFLSVLPQKINNQIYKSNRRTMAFLILLAIAGLPLVFDGTIQMLTSYESTNPMRMITGVPFGLIIAWLFCASMAARPLDYENDPSNVKLPTGMRFILPPMDENE